jgi:hypothetical protein
VNKPFDEALEFSQSGSDESVDTVAEKKKLKAMKPSISMETGPSSSSSFEVKQQNNLNSGLLDKSASSLKLGASGSQMSLSNNMQKQMAPVPVQQVCYIILSRPSVIKCISFIST